MLIDICIGTNAKAAAKAHTYAYLRHKDRMLHGVSGLTVYGPRLQGCTVEERAFHYGREARSGDSTVALSLNQPKKDGHPYLG